jgi:class 3 adenylate cyclase/tetratricopeptide (TPR) repeat protein
MSSVREERRYVTTLFGDVSGFTSMSGKLDPEELTEIINECNRRLAQSVDRYGGHVVKFVGDCIMALFGAPKAVEQAPRQACNAAIDMMRQITEVSAIFGRDLGIHVGINSGQAFVGWVGSETVGHLDAMGQPVNLAARLEEAAPRGDIWIGQETYVHVREDFELDVLAPLKLQGIEQPVQAYRLRSRTPVHQKRSPIARDPRLVSPLVGRTDELDRLSARIRRLGEGHGAVMTVVGEGGLGKSRLLAELLASPIAAGVTVLRGTGIAVGENLSYHLFVELIRRWADIAADDPEGLAAGKLDVAMHPFAGMPAADGLPFVARLLGLERESADAQGATPIANDALEILITKSVRDLLLAIAAQRPTLVVLDDLHWADRSSIALLIGLLPLVEQAPVAFLLAGRPDYLRTTEAVLEATRRLPSEQLEELRLTPLSSKQAGALLRNLIPIDERPATTRNVVLPKADGNPLFIEEVVRSLIEQGAIVQTERGLEVTDHIDGVVIPGTIQEVLMSRVERLPDAMRQVLELAAVIGPRFPRRLLDALVPAAEQLPFALAQLQRADLIQQSGQTDDDAHVDFRHPLVQETVYEAIPLAVRNPLHGRVAHAIEALFPDRLSEFYGMLALHYGKAKDVERATGYLMKAGADAARVAASTEALTFFTEALRLYELQHPEGGDTLVRVQLQKNIGLALLNRGDLPAALDRFDLALRALGERPPKGRAAAAFRFGRDVVGMIASVYLRGGVRRRAVTTPADCEELEIRMARGKAQSTTAPRGYVATAFRGVRRLGQVDASKVEQACGMYATGAALFSFTGASFTLSRRLLGIAASLVKNVRDEIGYRTMLFLNYYLTGDWDRRHLIADDLIDAGMRSGVFWDLNTYLGLACEQMIRQGDFAGARRYIDRITVLVDDYGYKFGRTTQLSMIAFLAIEERRLEDALGAAERYLDAVEEEALTILALSTRAKVVCLRGDVEAAAVVVREAETFVRRLGSEAAPYHLGPYQVARLSVDLMRLEASAQANRGVLPRELIRAAAASRAAALRASRRIARDRPEALRLAGHLAWVTGRRRKAMRYWRLGVAVASRLGARPELMRIYDEVADRLVIAADPSAKLEGDDAAALRARARAIAAELAERSDGSGARIRAA